MSLFHALKGGAVLVLAAVFQLSTLASLEVGEARPDVVLTLVVAFALLRGPVFGAFAGFWAGLVVDVAALGTLGLTSLLLTPAGYWCGRLGEATRRSSAHPPLVAVSLATAGVALGSLVVHFMLGSTIPASDFLLAVLLPGLALNLLLAYPVYRLAGWLLGGRAVARQQEASALV